MSYIKRRTPLKRSAPPRKKRQKPRRGEPTKEEKGVLRHFIYELSGGRCELNRPGCNTGLLPEDGELTERWHLVHRRAKRRFGWPIEGEFRMLGGCFSCHQFVHRHGWN